MTDEEAAEVLSKWLEWLDADGVKLNPLLTALKLAITALKERVNRGHGL